MKPEPNFDALETWWKSGNEDYQVLEGIVREMLAQPAQEPDPLQALTDLTQEMGLYEGAQEPVYGVDTPVHKFTPRYYAAPVMHKNAPNLDTSQERVQKSEKKIQILVEALKMIAEGADTDAKHHARAALAAVEKP
jgi:hypothetical protein